MYVYVYEHVKYQRALACASGNEIRFRLFARTFTRIKSNETLGKLEIRIGFLDRKDRFNRTNMTRLFQISKAFERRIERGGHISRGKEKLRIKEPTEKHGSNINLSMSIRAEAQY